MKKFNVLPQTSWSAHSLWKLETKSLLVLCLSLSLIGIGDGLLVLSNLGSAPWTVLSQGIALQAHFSVGWASFFVSILVMLMWIPLKLKAGIGTILNVILIALFLGLSAAYIPTPSSLFLEIYLSFSRNSLFWYWFRILFNLSSRRRTKRWSHGWFVRALSFKSRYRAHNYGNLSVFARFFIRWNGWNWYFIVCYLYWLGYPTRIVFYREK